ncbi:LysR family transcriptional regulator [Pelagibius sp. Alg239-R121]|uniref:LysR family transcriptional regulator n=1 Tax=Pelagibius sp. Alg239-R121 TaxID=2993448 RepID=UPI0024A77B65|nr:LysR family transcriptional regulator [Pelagibius sp. Alg239-R121]
MNWNAVSFDWNQARAFLATAEEGSLSAAARALGQTQPTLGRQVTALEQELGVVLFERIGRSLALTPSGLELLDHVRAMGEAAGRISLAASGQSQSIEGQVCISASDAMAAYILPGALKRLRAEAPKIEIEVVASNALSDLRRREADIAIRHVRPEQPDLIAKLVRDARAFLYAAPEYLDAHGRPETPEDLTACNFIGFGQPDRLIAALNEEGLKLSRHNFKAGSESGVVAWELTKQGLGIGIMAEEIAALTPGIERVLPDLPPFLFPIWLTTHRELHSSRRIRLVFDLLDEVLSERW